MSATALRTHRCGELTRALLGQEVRLGGWVHRRRDLGGLVFIDLRDRAGLVQLSCNPAWTSPEVMARAAEAGTESVVLVTGTVELRPEPSRDPALASREVEVHVTGLEVVGPAVTPAIPVARKEKEELPAEELRLKHRVLDLRRPELQRNLMLRHRLLQRSRGRRSPSSIFWRSRPRSSPSRRRKARATISCPAGSTPGEFYALPQSPQIYKQLLMVAGYDRYFQIARCFRDEDLRADRQPEFTQIDLEASFVSAEDVQEVVERVLADLWAEGGANVTIPFPRLGFRDSMERFGIDKPDLRFGYEIRDLTALIGDAMRPFLAESRAEGRAAARRSPWRAAPRSAERTSTG